MSSLAEPSSDHHSLGLGGLQQQHRSRSHEQQQRPVAHFGAQNASSDGDGEQESPEDREDYSGAAAESSDDDIGPAQDGQDGQTASQLKAAKRKRKNVSRACDRCRERKIKCSGEFARWLWVSVVADPSAGDEPTCKGCDKSKKQCVYRAHVDGRMT